MNRVIENDSEIPVREGDTFLYEISYGNLYLLRYCGESRILDEYYSFTTEKSGPILLNQFVISNSLYIGNLKSSLRKEILPYG